jgi:hypothetical protein
VLSFIDPAMIKPFTVILDAGSGMAGLVAPRLFERLPCRATRLCFEIDGTFPNHEANPLIEENRRDITEEVIRQKADVGIAWTGTPIGASSSTAAVNSSPAISSRRFSRKRSCSRTRAPRSSTIFARAMPSATPQRDTAAGR